MMAYSNSDNQNTQYVSPKLRVYRANRIKNDIIRQKSPIASDRANPKIAYEKSCCFNDGFLAYPMIKLPKTVPIPAPLPAAPTVAAPAPINLAADSISRVAMLVPKSLDKNGLVTGASCMPTDEVSTLLDIVPAAVAFDSVINV